MKLFDIPEISKTEHDIIAKFLADPIVKKYFKALAAQVGADIVMSAPQQGQDVQEYLRAVAQAQGKLHLLALLVAVEDSTEQQPSN